ncbi:MAG: hypothetical protein H6807_12500 [Planctomycetes bacterium]|nr:hypothetical protein [Planctomycetota bacterium]
MSARPVAREIRDLHEVVEVEPGPELRVRLENLPELLRGQIVLTFRDRLGTAGRVVFAAGSGPERSLRLPGPGRYHVDLQQSVVPGLRRARDGKALVTPERVEIETMDPVPVLRFTLHEEILEMITEEAKR